MSEVHPSASHDTVGQAEDDDWDGGLAYYSEVDTEQVGFAEAEDLRPPNKGV